MSNDNIGQRDRIRVSPRVGAAVIGGVPAAAAAIWLAIVTLIQPWEGVVYVPYRDVVGVLTVCWGHTGRDIVPGRRYTREECQALLIGDVTVHTEQMARCVHRPMPQNVFSALVSLTFNIGVNAVCRSTAMRQINAGNWPAACQAMRSWERAGGHVIRGLRNRRNAENAVCVRAAA